MACIDPTPTETPEDACLRAVTAMRILVKKAYECLSAGTDDPDLLGELTYLADKADGEVRMVYDLITGVSKDDADREYDLVWRRDAGTAAQ